MLKLEESQYLNFIFQLNYQRYEIVYCPIKGKKVHFASVKINVFFLLAGHKVDFIAPCGANESIF